ncbi:MAG: MFS transporter [Chloroflexi bacterium]|nr:MFS transporter [Chloroflexota bacterium]
MRLHVIARPAQAQRPAAPPAANKALGPFAALVDHQYQRYSIAALGSTTALAIETLARVWLLQQLTDSPLMVSLVPALLMLPMLFLSVPGGELADRFNRKTITLVYESFALVTYIGLAYLVVIGRAEPWHVLAVTLLQGIGAALSAPARQTLITDLVQTRQQRGALGLSMTVGNVASILGPAFGGLLIARYGMEHAFIAAAVIAVPALPLYLSLRPVASGPHSMHKGGMVRNLKEGVGYIAGDASLRWLLFACLVMIVTVNSWGALFPAFAEDVLNVGAGGLGVLSTAVGGGALAATILVVVISGRISDKTVEVVSGFLFAAFVLGVALSHSYVLTIVLVALAAFAATAFFQTNMTAVQLHAPEEFRGRVISVRFVAWGLQPAGLLALGGLAEAIGPQPALAIFSIAGAIVFGVLVVVLRPHHVRRLAEMQAAGAGTAARGGPIRVSH